MSHTEFPPVRPLPDTCTKGDINEATNNAIEVAKFFGGLSYERRKKVEYHTLSLSNIDVSISQRLVVDGKYRKVKKNHQHITLKSK